MSSGIGRYLAGAAAAGALVALAAAGPAAQAIPPDTRAFVNARIFDGTGSPLVENGVLVVRDRRIVAAGPAGAVSIPEDAERVDLGGRYVIPGLINTHGHVGDTVGLETGPRLYTAGNVLRQLELYARYGVTTVFSLGGDGSAGVSVREEQETGPLGRARLYVAGPVVTGPTPAEARAQVDEVADLKVDIVKIRVDDNLGRGTKMSEETLRAVIDRAHSRGLRVAAHIFYLEDAGALLGAGVDYIAHSVRDRAVDDDFVRLLRERDVCYCPTFTRELSTFVYAERPAFFDDPFFLAHADRETVSLLEEPERQRQYATSPAGRAYREALPTAKHNLRMLADAGVRIAFGTDTGPPGRFQGFFEHVELEMMVQAGLTPRQALLSATGDAARCMQFDDRLGTLQPGRWADFVVLRENPLEDILNTRTIESVWIAGNRLLATVTN